MSATRAGYSEKCAAQEASHLLNKPKIQRYLSLLRGQSFISGPLSLETLLNDLTTDYQRARDKGDARLADKLRDQLLKYCSLTPTSEAKTKQKHVSTTEYKQQLLDELKLTEEAEKAGTAIVEL